MMPSSLMQIIAICGHLCACHRWDDSISDDAAAIIGASVTAEAVVKMAGSQIIKVMLSSVALTHH